MMYFFPVFQSFFKKTHIFLVKCKLMKKTCQEKDGLKPGQTPLILLQRSDGVFLLKTG